ncbi:MAG: hypothetical protein A2087_11375 [Spirochaetes bacterium GWD1_61_31]|nr:MAG: hypothetical protein A2Y37_14605 [Spirochaetes bacterium GWB1_60_80]OHD31116.1 MAG: hypothetical protein A2004_06255 [Spirochaetes bacterium GWC1_61_12]OHD35802.1 MAG: hypothetical protein A2087_11375 [Spirochaetes bacterium GWD1_61_31]OHD46744.1 MAG: hypothetical protein A2Y35_10550 [Spirochaetes bacterium GWE1_60_18]OHD61195.1 MAG: hypothetical protein A2Y32_12840 [Spirochaetes bacterium GWF1_60_12]HAP43047.1 hypothetical protein [Spirochaetaceae bacterium]
MTNHLVDKHNPADNYRRNSRLALLIIGLIALTSLLIFQATLHQGNDDSQLVNLSGRQRMLSQQLVKDALLAIEQPIAASVRSAYLARIDHNLASWRKAHALLLRRNTERHYPGAYGQRIADGFQAIQPYFDRLASDFQELVSLGETAILPSRRASNDANDDVDARRRAIRNSLLANEEQFLLSMDRLTALYAQSGERRVAILGGVNLLLFAALASALVIVYLTIFSPLADRLTSYFHELNRTMLILSDQAATDPLTGLFNKRSGLLLLTQEFDRCRRDGSNLSVIFMDLDNLKKVNDSLGHEAGDRLIKHFADAVKAAIRSHDHAFRYGGDEFVIVQTGSDRASDKIVSRLEALLDCANRDCVDDADRASFSWGTASLEEERQGPAGELLRLADERMYANKKAKKAPSTTKPDPGRIQLHNQKITS